MNYVKGTQLSKKEQEKALAQFVHRFTGDHKPQWAKEEWKPGKPYQLQFANDLDWLEHTLFAITTSGHLDERVNHCESSPTWPENPELRK